MASLPSCSWRSSASGLAHGSPPTRAQLTCPFCRGACFCSPGLCSCSSVCDSSGHCKDHKCCCHQHACSTGSTCHRERPSCASQPPQGHQVKLIGLRHGYAREECGDIAHKVMTQLPGTPPPLSQLAILTFGKINSIIELAFSSAEKATSFVIYTL